MLWNQQKMVPDRAAAGLGLAAKNYPGFRNLPRQSGVSESLTYWRKFSSASSSSFTPRHDYILIFDVRAGLRDFLFYYWTKTCVTSLFLRHSALAFLAMFPPSQGTNLDIEALSGICGYVPTSLSASQPDPETLIDSS